MESKPQHIQTKTHETVRLSTRPKYTHRRFQVCMCGQEFHKCGTSTEKALHLLNWRYLEKDVSKSSQLIGNIVQEETLKLSSGIILSGCTPMYTYTGVNTTDLS